MDPLSPKEESALALLIQGASISEVAIRCQVSRTTIHAWIKKPQFKEALDSARSAIRQQAIARLASFTDRALDIIHSRGLGDAEGWDKPDPADQSYPS